MIINIIKNKKKTLYSLKLIGQIMMHNSITLRVYEDILLLQYSLTQTVRKIANINNQTE